LKQALGCDDKMKTYFTVFIIAFLFQLNCWQNESKAPILWDDEFIKNSDLKLKIENQIPEIKQLAGKVYRESQNEAKLIILIKSFPDSSSDEVYMREHYTIYVGENHPTHQVRIHTFMVHKDTKEIYWYDLPNNKYVPLKEWRKNKKTQPN
jgi:hypothetical protein